MALGKDYARQECSVARALEIIGERWTILIVRDAFYGVRRYNDFLVHLGVPRAVLAARLQSLTEHGILVKRRYQESPPREEYVLTPRGESLWLVLYGLGVWGRGEFGGTRPLREFRHARCDTPLALQGTCPHCGTLPEPGDIDMLPGPGLDPDPADPVSRVLLRRRRILDPVDTTGITARG
ncbi:MULTISPECIES: helix-turn-helix domain-containing protein [unclassified Streptomyces]|uniref:winged helix-turn-helix transcriptional regulator n=1 Tax=unclassified Streptomyces TaxID=2593676 RepID=UPI0010102913|nr:helix-turn-helix domain-containing protein [Streptomyces sp. GZWMJZ-114]